MASGRRPTYVLNSSVQRLCFGLVHGVDGPLEDWRSGDIVIMSRHRRNVCLALLIIHIGLVRYRIL